MKKIALTFSALFFTLISFSQCIAVQGLARDENNTARTNASVPLTFEIYYLNSSNNPVPVYSSTSTLQTDAFGVFSHVINLPNTTETQFSNHELYLKIKEGATEISNEVFKRVPLAYAASNGVPTGSIMPFIGTAAPAGWILCDGGAIPIDSNTLTLRTLLGSAIAPNLQGMFLRGTGTSPVNSQAGPALKTTQGDANKSHSHAKGSLATSNAGAHSHNLFIRKHWQSFEGEGGTPIPYSEGGDNSANLPTDTEPAHSHSITGSTANQGTESRPVNYGVNYIIKL
jgi:microcystin-dependent protein